MYNILVQLSNNQVLLRLKKGKLINKGVVNMQKGFIIILILALIIGVFAISNSGVVTVDFIFTEVLLSQAIVIFICVLLGALITSIFGLIRQMSLKKEIKELKNKNKDLDFEVNELNARLISKDNELSLLKSKEDKEVISDPQISEFSNN